MVISNNEELEALAQRLFPKFNEFLMRNSKNIFSCELATSLDGILTMPALYDKDGVQKQVIAPLKLLTKDVDAQIEACKQATTAATTAATKANTAAKAANDATAELDAKKKEVDAAVSACTTATSAAKTATSDTLASKKAIEANEEARKTAEKGRVDAEKLRAAAETKRETDFNTAQNAVKKALNVAVATDNQVKANETTRIQNEKERQRNETTRIISEDKREAAETTRKTAEDNRVKAEQKRASDTAEALAASKAQTATCKQQTDIAEDVNAHPITMGDNGNWYRWNTSKQQYEDTGIIARGGVMFPSFRHKRNKLQMLDYSSNIINRVKRKRNKLKITL